MHLWLNVETAKWVLDHFDIGNCPPAWDWGDVTWRVCPECCYVEPQHSDHSCPRPKGEVNVYGGVFSKPGYTLPCECSTLPVPDTLNDALWSALRVGGTNAVVDILKATPPEAIGLVSSSQKMRERWARLGRKKGKRAP